MIVVDTSALIAVIRNEPERDRFLQILLETDEVVMSSATYVEARSVLRRWYSAS
jgi:Uncharacterized protein conserved in bacteria